LTTPHGYPALELLSHHKHIPHLLAYFEQEAEFYLVEEFIEGIALKEQLATGQT
jgi:serine/threonine protein kinase